MESEWKWNIVRYGFSGSGKLMGGINGTADLVAELITPIPTLTGQYVCQMRVAGLPSFAWLGHSLFSEPENCNEILFAGFSGFPNPFYPVISQW